MLKVENLIGGYSSTPVIKDVSFKVEKGTMLGILGPNGCGKSTLLKLISGIITPTTGSVFIDQVNQNHYSAKELAKKMTVLPQLHGSSFSNTVRDTVSIGRYPHQKGFFSSWSNTDEEAVVGAMNQTGVTSFEHIFIENLSGGERQRVFIAQALAQKSDLLLLDEPTNHLDIAHQQQLLDMIRKEVVDQGLTVVSVFHDINLASLYCDRILLIDSGVVRAFGEPHEVLLESEIMDVYHAKVASHAHPIQPKPQITLLPEIPNDEMYNKVTINNIKKCNEYVMLKTDFPLRVLSSAVHNAGLGWYSILLNRTVQQNYHIEQVKEEYLQYIMNEGLSPTNTVGMMTAVDTQDAVIKSYDASFGTVFVIVTAGVGNAIDVSKAYTRDDQQYIGTINTWIIINGNLSDEAFVQGMMTATEAKTKALQHEKVYDTISNTIATGTPTDSLLIAATQQGKLMQYAGPITEVGKVIGRGVFEAISEAIQNSRKGE